MKRLVKNNNRNLFASRLALKRPRVINLKTRHLYPKGKETN